ASCRGRSSGSRWAVAEANRYPPDPMAFFLKWGCPKRIGETTLGTALFFLPRGTFSVKVTFDRDGGDPGYDPVGQAIVPAFPDTPTDHSVGNRMSSEAIHRHGL